MRLATREEIEALPYNEAFKDGGLSLFFTSQNDGFMAYAKDGLVHSTDKNHSTSAVVVLDDRIVERASNQSGYKFRPLIWLHATFPKWFCVRRRKDIPSGQGYHLCKGCAKSEDHAEYRASKLAYSRMGTGLKGATLYLYGHWWCCKPCCDAMVASGIGKVVLVEGAKDLFTRR